MRTIWRKDGRTYLPIRMSRRTCRNSRYLQQQEHKLWVLCDIYLSILFTNHKFFTWVSE